MRVVGLISGTSVDGIDAALVDISGGTDDLQLDLIAAATYPYPEALRSQILAVCHGAALSMADLAALDDAIAASFAVAALAIQENHPPAELIGSHGQTVYHRPPTPTNHLNPQPLNLKTSPSLGYSLQLGRGTLIAHLTQIPTVSNFRVADIAAGGEGAPLVSALDVCLLSHPTLDRCVQNIGGIGNVTYLPALTQPAPEIENSEFKPQTSNLKIFPSGTLREQNSKQGILGWDTGPGNALLDLATQNLSQGELSFDRNGAWAAQGTPCQPLVQQWLQQDFFQQLPPKSTGRELFGQSYLDRCLQDATSYNLNAADILATLTELTAASIAHSYRTFLPKMPEEVLVCGGGSHNCYLKDRLQANLNSIPVYSTTEIGLNADFKEAITFAVLAYWRKHNIPGNLPEVTGAKQRVLLGEIHLVA